MPIRNSYPIEFVPAGLTDSTEEIGSFPGALTSMMNLVPDPTNPTRIMSRPGVGTPVTSFAGFTTPTGVSVHISVGTKVYGMVSTGRYAGHDEPFCYDMVTGIFSTISGVTSANTPLTQPTTGAWEPPTMAVVGNYVLITHPGYGSNPWFGAINLTTLAYTAQNTSTHSLPGRPTAVANYNNRAWFVIGNQLWYTDVLSPLTMSNANEALTVGNNASCTALIGLPVQTSSAGVLQALLVFKSNSVWQVSGDAALSTLSINWVSLSVGTSSPRSVAATAAGVIFLGPDGHYIIRSVLQEPQPLVYPGQPYQDVRQPFQNATYPSRVAAAGNGILYRTSLATTINGSAKTYDYWFDMRRMRWSGPHTFNYDCASPYSHGFVLSSSALGAYLFYSPVIPTEYGMTYNDNGTDMVFSMQTTLLKAENHMTVKQISEMISIHASRGTEDILLEALDLTETLIDSVTLASGVASGVWGQAGLTWGQSGLYWSAWVGLPEFDTVPWTKPLVFKRIIFRQTGLNGVAVQFGPLQARVQDAGYSNLT